MFQFVLRPLTRIFHVRSVVTAFDVVRPKDFYFEGEMHDFWEVVYVVGGRADVTADERSYTLSRGQMIFHKPMEFHRIWSTGGTAPHLLILTFTAEGEGMRRFEDRVFSLDLEEEELLKNAVRNSRELLQTAEQEGEEGDAYRLPAHMAAAQLELLLLRLLLREAAVKAPEESENSAVYRQVVKVMKDHGEEDLKLEDIAALCNLSASSLKKIFHRFSDMGVMKYFTYIKIRRAIALLEEGRSIADISERLSFSSQNYFTVVFKRETGVSPGVYRNRLKKRSAGLPPMG